ncbi:MAG: FKBP-type peptidyl-prolyl cis-trans isomerase [Candidatus Sumerlaeaceae bacterium]|nr:FKBP-type peptidyl-prolyl cis-trans isomerase [Candidatus Sumerlaeaceae bacterium]
MSIRITAVAGALLALTFSLGHAETTKTAEAKAEAKSEAKAAKAETKETKMNKTPGGTQTEDIVVGTGAEAVAGKNCTVHYTGTLTNGRKFDSSKDRNEPFTVANLGNAPVIKGWNEGIVGMKVGGKRKLTIPADQGYGKRGFPPVIPPDSVLIFEVELLDVK